MTGKSACYCIEKSFLKGYLETRDIFGEENKGLVINRIPYIRDKFDHHMHEVISGASVAFVLRVLGAGLAFGFNVYLARIFGAEGAGIYFLALTVLMIASVFGRMGLNNALLRFVAAGASVGDWAEVKGVYNKGMAMAVSASIIATVAMFLMAPFIATSVFGKPELAGPVRWMALSVLPMTLAILHAELLKGLKRIRDSVSLQFLGVPALSFAGLYLIGSSWGVEGAVLAYTGATIFTALAGLLLWRVATPRLKEIKGRFDTQRLLRSCTPLFWSTLMSLLMNWTAIFMLGIWGTSEDVGIFGVASRTAMLISLILVAVNSIAAPKFAELHRRGDMQALGRTARSSAKLMTMMVSPVFLFFIFFPDLVLSIFGSEFIGGGTVLIILAIGQFVNVATGSVGYLLMMSGNEHLMRNITGVSALVNILLNLWLIPIYGILGAAIATTVSLSVQNFMAAFHVFKSVGVVTLPWVSQNR